MYAVHYFSYLERTNYNWQRSQLQWWTTNCLGIYIAKWSINNLYQVVCFSSYILNLLDCPSDLRCANTAAWNVPADFQGDGVSSKWENCTQRPCCQKLHVSCTTQFRSMCSVLQHCCHYATATLWRLLQGCSTCGCVSFYHSNTAQDCV